MDFSSAASKPRKAVEASLLESARSFGACGPPPPPPWRQHAEAGCAEDAAKAREAPSLLALLPAPAVRVACQSHVGAAQTNDDCREAISALRAEIVADARFCGHVPDDNELRRFLTARGNDVEKAHRLLVGALEWSTGRLPRSPDFQELECEARTGKMRVTGLDAYGRAVVVFDASAQNTQDAAAHLRFVAFNLRHAVRRMEGTSVEKFVIFLHLSGLSLSKCPSRALLKDTCNMLATCFPERCGNLIFHQAPRVFSGLYALCKPFIQPRTAAKFVFIAGDDSPGSANDATLRELIGVRWRELSGVGEPREAAGSSPGYVHQRDWAKTVAFEYAWHTGQWAREEACDATLNEQLKSIEADVPASDASTAPGPSAEDDGEDSHPGLGCDAHSPASRSCSSSNVRDMPAELGCTGGSPIAPDDPEAVELALAAASSAEAAAEAAELAARAALEAARIASASAKATRATASALASRLRARRLPSAARTLPREGNAGLSAAVAPASGLGALGRLAAGAARAAVPLAALALFAAVVAGLWQPDASRTRFLRCLSEEPL
eukprot:TRINITY_DN62794_c0_g1_i1.p1 TRINITY_DN62794_c0_g1~~TRINITY_DN62794_c0_g1_i1.p1  ORF type:complete len:553 (-),score=124.37 TRINITY_DN62794_c0_g1_i1:138-1796(-)